MKRRELTIKDEMTRNALMVFLTFCLFGGLIIYEVAALNWNAESYIRIDHVSKQEVPAYRGNIYDRDLELLATSLPFFRASIDFGSDAMSDELFNSNVDSLAIMISDLFGEKDWKKRKTDMLNHRKSKSRFYRISDHLDYNAYLKIKNFPLLREGRFRGGFRADPYFDRMHPFGDLARRSIGFEAKDGIHDVGLERVYDDILKGKNGLRTIQRINEDLWLPVGEGNIKDPIAGKNIKSTLDMSFQEIVHNELERALKYHHAHSGVAILMDVKTGDIRAMSSLTETSPYVYKEILNNAVQSGGDPGSTFKAASLLALLESESVTISTSVPTFGGEFKVYDRKIKDSSKPDGDSLSMINALAKSSNVVFASQVQEHFSETPERFVNLLNQFGLRSKTLISLENELNPYIKHPNEDRKNWYGTSLAMMAYGYEMRLSPLQMLQFYNTIANDGVMVKPRIVSEILNDQNRIIQEFPPEIVSNRIASSASVHDVQKALREVVLSGTASHDKIETVCDFAGKTGTTQINYSSKIDGEPMRYSGSFIGYFPVQAPRYSLIVRLSHPRRGGYYGAQIALPAFKRIMNLVMSSEEENMLDMRNKYAKAGQAVKNLSIAKGESKDVEILMDYILAGADKMVQIDHNTDIDEFSNNEVPDVRHLGLRDALFLLENRGLKVVIKGTGKVVSQSVKPGTLVQGQTVKIILS